MADAGEVTPCADAVMNAVPLSIAVIVLVPALVAVASETTPGAVDDQANDPTDTTALLASYAVAVRTRVRPIASNCVVSGVIAIRAIVEVTVSCAVAVLPPAVTVTLIAPPIAWDVASPAELTVATA